MNINYIVSKKMCSGCGMCVPICPTNSIKIIKGKISNYPLVDQTCIDCGKCMKVCPGNSFMNRINKNELKEWGAGRAKEIYVGNSTNRDIRYKAASGGVVTSLLIYMINKNIIDGAIVVTKDKNNALKNKSIYAITSDEILESLGSRYNPVSNCEIISKELLEKNRIAFVGKPCEIEALKNYLDLNNKLKEKVIVKISIMCAAQTFNINVEKLLKDNGIDVDQVISIDFRGRGWPGSFNVKFNNGKEYSMPYMKAWNKYFSKKYPLRCKICDNSLGNDADIVVGDPWNKIYSNETEGKSMFFARTIKGKEIIKECIKNSVIETERLKKNEINKFQNNLLLKYNRLPLEHLAYSIVFMRNFNKKYIVKLSLKDKIKIVKKSGQDFIIKYKNYYV